MACDVRYPAILAGEGEDVRMENTEDENPSTMSPEKISWESATKSMAHLRCALNATKGKNLRGPSSPDAIRAICRFGDTEMLDLLFQYGYMIDHKESICECIDGNKRENLIFIIDETIRKNPRLRWKDFTMDRWTEMAYEHRRRVGAGVFVYDNFFAKRAIALSNYECFVILHEKNMVVMDAGLFTEIISYVDCGSERVKMYQYLLDNQCPQPGGNLCYLAAKGRCLDIVRHLVQSGYQHKAAGSLGAAESGCLAILKYLHESKQMFIPDTLKSAVWGGYIDCVDYLFEIECPIWDLQQILEAALNGEQMEMFKHLHEKHKLPLTRYIFHCALMKGNTDFARYCHANEIEFDDISRDIVKRCGSYDIRKFADEVGEVPRSDDDSDDSDSEYESDGGTVYSDYFTYMSCR